MSFAGCSQLIGKALVFGITLGGNRLSTRLLGASCALFLSLAGCRDRLCGSAGLFGSLRFGNTAGFGALALLLVAASVLGRFAERLGRSELLGAALFFGDALSLALPGEGLLAGSFASCSFGLAPFFGSFCVGGSFQLCCRLCFVSSFRFCRGLRISCGFSFGNCALGLRLNARGSGLAFLFSAALGIGLGGKTRLGFIGCRLGRALGFELFAAGIGFASGVGEHVGLIGLHAIFGRLLLGSVGLALLGDSFLFGLGYSTLLRFFGRPIGLHRKLLSDGVTIGALCQYGHRWRPETGRNCNPKSRH